MKNQEKGADLSTATNGLQIIIEDRHFQWGSQYILGRQVRELYGVSQDVELFLAIKKPWEDELIRDEDKVNLARPGIERFYFKHILLITINDKKYKWYEQYITGAQLRVLGGIPENQDIFLSVSKPWVDELISNDTKVDLARPSIEHFYSKEREHDVYVTIKVNDKEKKILAGIRTVAEIKAAGGVPSAYELEQLIDGRLTPLADDAQLEIKGGEQFFGHCRDGSSS